MTTKHELLTVRIEGDLNRSLDELVKERAEGRSEIVREALQEFISKQAELKEIKSFIAKKFAEGSVSFDELVRLLGYREARKVAFYVETARKSFEAGLKV